MASCRARSGVGVANEKTPVLDPEIIVENGLGGGVHLDLTTPK
jgi:hypothetical protein